MRRPANPPRKSKGKPIAIAYKGDPITKTERDTLAFAHTWKMPRAVFDEATLPARRNIVRQIAADLCATIHFAGEVFTPPPVSLLDARPPAPEESYLP